MTDSPAASIAFLLRHLGAQTTRELADSLGLSFLQLDAALADLQAAGRIEADGRGRWRLIPAHAIPTGNPGTL